MTFYSPAFALFFAVTLTLYFASPHARRVPLLLAASTLFYVSFVPQYIFILLALIAVGFFIGIQIDRSTTRATRRTWLIVSIAANLLFMAAFKYSADVFGRPLGPIPVGLSFHTFQAMAYAIEVFRGRQAAERSFTVYALYIMFFPQLTAGPIERPQDLLPQFRKPHPFRYEDAVGGLQLMAWGMFQKYVVADRLALLADVSWAPHARISGPITALAAVAFAFQIYCDFAGYSDIAVGAAQMLGFRLSRNFNAPFHADSMAEYWRRWHISLSTWMRDYVFFPLCGRRPRMPRICASIVLVFLANGLWHGARWNYLASGLLHGLYRVVELLAGRAFSRRGWSIPERWSRAARVGRTMLVFSLMTFAFLFFRGESLAQTLGVIGRLASNWGRLFHPTALAAELAGTGLRPFYVAEALAGILVVEAVLVLRSAGPIRPRIAAMPPLWRWGLYYASAASVLLLAASGAHPFIYFRF